MGQDVGITYLDDVEVRGPAGSALVRSNVDCTTLGSETRLDLRAADGASSSTCASYSGRGASACLRYFYLLRGGALVPCEHRSADDTCADGPATFCHEAGTTIAR